MAGDNAASLPRWQAQKRFKDGRDMLRRMFSKSWCKQARQHYTKALDPHYVEWDQEITNKVREPVAQLLALLRSVPQELARLAAAGLVGGGCHAA